MAELEMLTIDAFADRPFAGNPAGVCFLDEPRDDAFLLDVAREMNLSETAFLLPGSQAWDLRWFTPAMEVDLCGHATLASAHALWETGRLDRSVEAHFDTKSGRLSCALRGEQIEMDFPSQGPDELPAPAGMLEALGVDPAWVGGNVRDWLIEVADESAVRAVAPDFGALKGLPGPHELPAGFIVTARAAAGTDADVVSRFFAPAYDVDEDPVTGSAHCCLAPYWAAKLGRDDLVALQLSRRTGRVGMRVEGDRVKLLGHAVTVLRGTLSA